MICGCDLVCTSDESGSTGGQLSSCGKGKEVEWVQFSVENFYKSAEVSPWTLQDHLGPILGGFGRVNQGRAVGRQRLALQTKERDSSMKSQ